jgi:uncharacterized membrane protein (DUF106 family)
MVDLTIIPSSTFFILLLSFFLSLVTSLTNRLLTNRAQMKAWSQEISEWNKELRIAQRNKDKKNLEKLMKKQKYILQLQSKMTWQSMKTSFLWFIPLLLLWWFFLTPLYSRPEGLITVAYIPWFGSEPLPLSYVYWYLLCSILSGAILSRLLGLGMGGD